MTHTQQPEALRLAEILDKYALSPIREVAAELRRQHARIAELEAQLSAIGAGGVEPLRKSTAAPQAVQAAVPVPDSILTTIGWLLDDAMNAAVKNGANSISMPDDYVALAAWLAGVPAHPAEELPEIVKLDRGFRWVSEKRHHVPTLLLEFTPVPVDSPNTEKGWADRDALAYFLAAKAKNGDTQS